ncbi:MAG: type IV toxin-antitoxin system AbiEi family antitoxin domain-containing protein [Ellagibacter isourolithinifaciens]|uniref:Zn-binding domain-containing protein n=1 Tax=Ellagibacter isourolithinifaciens TaxID=2137581 RepID=UPI002A91AE01|nr:type IV toxin-antitoxin system AbiEi family antitoxin domain-containing protein [Ellagibacter isourolithinifaciens]MDY6111537.1 type IV toxin-antitoxin system AbiEi family antitoxin domain-containing protein [Ellagibacter isourolithinifaciens]
MLKSDNITSLELLAASQWGMFTTAQAQALGVRENQVSRTVDAFWVEPACHGVYWLRSTLWALFAAASHLLEIPEAELGGTMHEEADGFWSVMIYAGIPGGASHSKWLYENDLRLFNEAYRIVDGRCGCSDEMCRCDCIAIYHNQQDQSKLSRGAAKRYFGELLEKENRCEEKGEVVF